MDVRHRSRGTRVRWAVPVGLALLALCAVSARASEGTVMAPGGRDGLIAFDSEGDIWVSMADGSGRARLTSGPAFDLSPMWSPDGRHLAYWSMPVGKDMAVTGFDYDAYVAALQEPHVSLLVADGDGTDPRVVAEGLVLGTGSFTAAVPAWSPDASRLAIPHLVAGSWVIDLVPADGGPMTRLVAPGSDPSWSPDGSLVAYRGGASGADAGVYLVGADGSDPHRLTQKPSLTQKPTEDTFTAPQWSPDGGTIVYFSGLEGTGDVWAVDADGTNERVFIGGPGNEYRAVFSPDGTRIAFDRTRETADIVRFVVSPADLSSEVTLEGPPMWGMQPVWAPAGDLLVGYRSSDGNASPSLVVVDPTGERPAWEIEAPGQIGVASWQRIAP